MISDAFFHPEVGLRSISRSIRQIIKMILIKTKSMYNFSEFLLQIGISLTVTVRKKINNLILKFVSIKSPIGYYNG